MSVFKKLSKEINFNITKSFKEVEVKKAKLDKKSVFNLEFFVNEIIPFEEMLNFMVHLNNNFKYKTNFSFNVTSIVYEESNVMQYMLWIIKHYLKKPNLAIVLHGSSLKINNEGEVKVNLEGENLCNQFLAISSDVERVMKKFGFTNFNFKITKLADSNILFNEEKKLAEEAANFVSSENNDNNNGKKSYQQKRNGYTKLEIDELLEAQEQYVQVEGEIFDLRVTKTKNDLKIYTFSITNYKDAVYCKMFARSIKDSNEADAFKVGDFVAISGQYQFDQYINESSIVIRKIQNKQNTSKSRYDDAPIKRVELSARTRMSTMDGIVSAKDLIWRAKVWEHKAIAICDTDSVQSFPEFYHASKNSGVKPIYGVSLSSLSKNNGAIYNSSSKTITDQTYVVFDLETTGLSPIFEDIIEFGAVKIKSGQIIDRQQFFIKPSKPIPEFISKITNITNKDVENSISESEAINDIINYFEDSVLIAHNASFDFNFINEKLDKYNLPRLKNIVVDSLVISRIVQPQAKKFRLESVAKRYNVNYESTIAHRADYDADVLAKVWLRMIDDLKELNFETFLDISQYHSEELYSKSFPKEVTILAKNQEGLKELFGYVSSSLTTNLNKKPITFIEDLANRKNVLLGSGGLKSRLVDLIFYGSKNQIKDEIKKYDYIEIHPMKNYIHKFNEYRKEDIEKLIKWIVQEAQSQGKIVVATGDVRYVDAAQKIYHEVYIGAKGLGGVRHFLYKYNSVNPEYPTLDYLTTEEMLEEFKFLKDKHLIENVVINNSVAIANQIEEVVVIKEKLYTPKFGDSNKLLEELVYKNARNIYGNSLPQVIEDRIKREIEPIKKYGFAVIYWISHLLVAKSLKDGYLVGSRGSVGSSFVATMANITEVNPLDPHYLCSNKECKYSEFSDDFLTLNSGYDLADKNCPKCGIKLLKEGQKIPFETFLGFEADKVPDIDLNFSGEYQPIIHNEVKKIFGQSHSFRAGTISTVAEKTAFGYVKAWAEDNNKHVSKAFIEYLAKGVAGTKRTTGQHPGGIIVIPKEYDVEDFSPVNYPANDKNSAWKTTHFDFHAIHDNVLKLDLLGHDDPTAIRYLEKLTGVDVKKDIPFYDENIIKLFSSTDPLNIKPEDIDGESTGAMGIPEFGTRFVRKMLKTAKVKSFGDLIAVSGLSHGTDVWTRNAEQIVKELGLELKDLISCRDNIMTDLMEKFVEPKIAFNIMEKVRKGKGLTVEEEELLRKHGIEDWYIESLQKIKYMFPKAHATAYVMMAWRVAWFKLYHPEAYYATYFTTRADVFDISTVVLGKSSTLEKLRELKNRKGNGRNVAALSKKEEDLIPILELALECFARGIKIGNISLKKSLPKNWIIDPITNELTPPFISIDGLGEAVADSIFKAREEKEFTSKEDLQKRTSLNKTNIKKLEDLGALKDLSETNQVSLFDVL